MKVRRLIHELGITADCVDLSRRSIAIKEIVVINRECAAPDIGAAVRRFPSATGEDIIDESGIEWVASATSSASADRSESDGDIIEEGTVFTAAGGQRRLSCAARVIDNHIIIGHAIQTFIIIWRGWDNIRRSA